MFTDLALRARRGELLPEGVAIDVEGRPTRDPVLAQLGAALSFGGYKGFALAAAMQALGVFAGSGEDIEEAAGYLIIAMKPDLLLPLKEYRRDLSAAIERLKTVVRDHRTGWSAAERRHAPQYRDQQVAGGVRRQRTHGEPRPGTHHRNA